MSPHTLLRSLLLLPLMVPLLAWGLLGALRSGGVKIVGEVSGNAWVLLLSIFVGGVPYLLTAAFLWWKVGRCKSQKSALLLMFTAPLIFIALQVLVMLLGPFLRASAGESLADKFEEGLMGGFIAAAYGLLFGYFYATCAAIIFYGAVRLRLVSGFARGEPQSADTNLAYPFRR